MTRWRLWWIVAAFLAVQACIIWFAATGPFVDESLYTVAGMRVLEGQAGADGYLTWFNGSPFVWPVIAALGHHVAGLSGARFMAAILATLTLAALAATAENLFGRSVASWSALAFGVNGLFMALAHFAVYDVLALAALAVSMWCVTRPSAPETSAWVLGAAIAFAVAVIAKYGYMLMIVPLAGLLVSARGIKRSGPALAVFLSAAGGIVAGYFWLAFGSLVPASSAAYLEQTFWRTRGHIAMLQIVFGFVPVALASAGAFVAWRRRERLLIVTCLVAVSLFPAFHLWTATFVSGQKHVVAGFLFAYLLAGLALDRLWASRSRATAIVVLAVVTLWGGLQCYWQDRSWSDTRALARYLALNMQRGDRIVAESSWNYVLYLYPRGLIESPAAVIDANYPSPRDRRETCRVRWLVGNPDSAAMIRDAVGRCRYERVLSSTTQHYYFDTTRLRLGVYSAVVGVYRLPAPSW